MSASGPGGGCSSTNRPRPNKPVPPRHEHDIRAALAGGRHRPTLSNRLAAAQADPYPPEPCICRTWTDWAAHTPPEVLALNFGVPADSFRSSSKAEAAADRWLIAPHSRSRRRPGRSPADGSAAGSRSHPGTCQRADPVASLYTSGGKLRFRLAAHRHEEIDQHARSRRQVAS